MIKLPYFKFISSEWINGSITLENAETQCAFINICAWYWHKGGDLTLTEAKRRLSEIKPTAFDSLINGDFISVQNDLIKIKFLDEQFIERGHVSEVNSKNGLKGGRPKGSKTLSKKPTALFSESETKPKESNKEEEEEIEKKKIFIPPTLFEVVEYFSNNGYTTESANKAYEYYQVANWIDSKGNKVKNWKQKMQGVWFKDENKAKVKPGDKMVW